MTGPSFGADLGAHVVTSRYWDGHWSPLRAETRPVLALSPATMGLHYGQCIFEGLKCHIGADGWPRLFRPRDHATRFQASAARLCMPTLPIDVFVEAVAWLSGLELAARPAASLYLRPLMFADEASIGVRPSDTYTFVVMAVPPPPPRTGGVHVWIEQRLSRAAPGGTGAVKCAGNYAAALAGQAVAVEHGCDQVLWTDAATHRTVEELSGSNVFVVHMVGDEVELITPKLSDTVLPGITRDSILRIARSCGLTAVERDISVDELWHLTDAVELFGTGTAAGVLPITRLTSATRSINLGPGRIVAELRSRLAELQTGREPDRFGWLRPVEPCGSVAR